jgi:hypothetical protein
LVQFLLSIGFIHSKVDTNVYLQCDGNNFIILAIYIDDCLLITNDEILLHKIKHQLSTKFEMTDLGPVKRTSILGLEIVYHQEAGCLKICQSKYIQSLLEKFKMESCNPVSTPMEPGIKLTEDDCPNSKEEIAQMKNHPYKILVGNISYISLIIRLDDSLATSTVVQYLANLGLRRWIAGKRILRYLKGTLDLGLLYTCTNQPLLLRGFSDADWAGSLDDRRSTSGYCFMLG